MDDTLAPALIDGVHGFHQCTAVTSLARISDKQPGLLQRGGAQILKNHPGLDELIAWLVDCTHAFHRSIHQARSV